MPESFNFTPVFFYYKIIFVNSQHQMQIQKDKVILDSKKNQRSFRGKKATERSLKVAKGHFNILANLTLLELLNIFFCHFCFRNQQMIKNCQFTVKRELCDLKA